MDVVLDFIRAHLFLIIFGGGGVAGASMYLVAKLTGNWKDTRVVQTQNQREKIDDMFDLDPHQIAGNLMNVMHNHRYDHRDDD